MPELPEVETVRRGLAPVLTGRVLANVTLRRGDLRKPFPHRFAARLTGRRVERLTRRAKYLLIHLDSHEILLVHLGMSGRFSINKLKQEAHDHVVFVTDHGTQIVYSDHRRFGLMTVLNSNEQHTHKLLAQLGPEPLERQFSTAYLSNLLRSKSAPIKAVLLDQRVVAGLGNIYVCEALFRSGVSPKRAARAVSDDSVGSIVKNVRAVLRDAILAGGSTLRDHKQVSGDLGYFQNSFAVYGREEEPCLRRGCKGRIARIVQSGRSTFYCATCQR